MQVKLKKCKICGGEFKQYNSLDKCPNYDCRKALMKKKTSKKKVSPAKKKYNYIKPVADKRLGELAIYRPLRDAYIEEHPICEVKSCDNPTTNLHHKNGRLGKMVYNVKYFMACCHVCHPARIHENPEWAREEGYLI